MIGTDRAAFGIRRAPWPFRTRLLVALLVWAILLTIAWLDRRAPLHVRHAEIFSLIWSGIQALAGWIGAAGGAIATSLSVVVEYLVTAVAWLGSRVASILFSTGSIFAKVWEGLKVVWTDVLKPALSWLDAQLRRLQSWLKATFQPVFDVLKRIRTELQAIYKRFVQPIVDTIEFIRQVNRVLLAFHIDVLKKLDATLQQLEQKIEEPFLWVNAQLNKLTNAVNLIVGADGLFQKLTLVRSLSKTAPAWMNGFWNKQIDKAKVELYLDVLNRPRPPKPVDGHGIELGKFYRGEDNTIQASVDELVSIWRVAAGLDAAA